MSVPGTVVLLSVAHPVTYSWTFLVLLLLLMQPCSAGREENNKEMDKGKMFFSWISSLLQLSAELNKLHAATRAQVALYRRGGGKRLPPHALSPPTLFNTAQTSGIK